MTHRSHLLLLAVFLGSTARAAFSDSSFVHGLDEVVVTGSNKAMSRNLLPYTVSVVDSRQLEATGKTQLLSALSGKVPSLFVSQRGFFGFGVSNGGSGGIKIRGVGGSPTSGVLMMVDGQPQFAGLYSHPVADFYGTEYVDHVEILRGPGSVLYGSNAMGGVVNVITRQARQDGVHTTLSSQYGSYNTWQTSLTNMARHGKFSSLVSLSYDRTDGTEANFDFKQKSLYAKVGYDISRRWALAADYSLMNFRANDPVYARLRGADYVIHQNVTRGESSLALSNRYASTDGVVRLYYSYGNHYIDDPNHFHSLDDRFGILAYQNFSPWHMATSTIGFDFNVYSGRIPMSGGNSSGNGTLGRKNITEYSPYVTLQQSLFHGLLSLSGGLRMANSDKFGSHWLPQVGFALYPAQGWAFRASMAKGYRNPSFRELYLYPPHNPDLDPESMMNYEVTLSRRFSRYLGVDLTGYFAEGSNIIQTVSGKNVNTGNFRNKGVEFSATSRPLDVLSLRASYSYMYTSLVALTAAPKNQYFLGVDYDVLPQLTVTAELTGVGGLYVADGIAHQNYALLNMRLTYKPIKYVDIFVNLDNITNASYMINNGYSMPGFAVMGGFKVRF